MYLHWSRGVPFFRRAVTSFRFYVSDKVRITKLVNLSTEHSRDGTAGNTKTALRNDSDRFSCNEEV